jgi:hypothetical protein
VGRMNICRRLSSRLGDQALSKSLQG